MVRFMLALIVKERRRSSIKAAFLDRVCRKFSTCMIKCFDSSLFYCFGILKFETEGWNSSTKFSASPPSSRANYGLKIFSIEREAKDLIYYLPTMLIFEGPPAMPSWEAPTSKRLVERPSSIVDDSPPSLYAPC